MKISREWLQDFFTEPLPDAAALAEALTLHAFEIESVEPYRPRRSIGGEDMVLDVKVTPNRGHDALSHRGIAKELSAILDIPLKKNPLREAAELIPTTDGVSVSIEDPKLCKRYIAGYIKGVKVAASPEWLRKSLEAIGQKSINNVVDATNLVMFNTGQPLHAFDAGQLVAKNGMYAIGVRLAKKGERMLALDDKEYKLSDTNLVIADDNAGVAIGIAGVKGGKPAGITEATKDIIIESANFDGVSVRKTSQALKLRTDASQRFEQAISPELAGVGMQQAVNFVTSIAGGEVLGFADAYPEPQTPRSVAVSLEKINTVLGTSFSAKEVASVFERLGLPFTENKQTFTVSIPSERLDLVIPEDLIEEVGRIIGYGKIPAAELPALAQVPEVNQNFYWSERVREDLMSDGYSEVCMSVFAGEGERAVANKIGGEKPYLRTSLISGLEDALSRNALNKDLLGIPEARLFEIGTVCKGGKEKIMVGVAGEKGGVSEKTLADMAPNVPLGTKYESLPVSQAERYQPFSKYPFIVRDISLWVPSGTTAERVLNLIRSHAGELLVRSEKFDEYKNEKTGKTSFAFRLVFQSFDRTLTDEDANERMESIYVAVKKEGWEVR